MVDTGDGRSKAQEKADIALEKDFRGRMTRLLEDLDAAGESAAAIHVEQAIAKLS